MLCALVAPSTIQGTTTPGATLNPRVLDLARRCSLKRRAMTINFEVVDEPRFEVLTEEYDDSSGIIGVS